MKHKLVTSRKKVESSTLIPWEVAPHQVPLFWSMVEPMLQRSLDKSFSMMRMETLFLDLVNGVSTLFMVTRQGEAVAVLVARTVQYGGYKAARITACAGTCLREVAEHLHVLQTWALDQDCVEIEAWCRPAMVRLVRRFGWQPKLTIVSLDIRRKLQ